MARFFRSFFIFCSFFFIICFDGAVSDKPWSRSEMVEMAGYGEEKVSSVYITGSLLCHACSDGHDRRSRSSPIPADETEKDNSDARILQPCSARMEPDQPPSERLGEASHALGASVAVKCHTGDRKRSGWIKAVTDESGEFMLDLPSQLHAIPNLENKCLVRVLHVPRNSKCSPSSAKKQRGLRLFSSGNGVRVYTAGSIGLHHFTSRTSQSHIGMSST